MPPKATTPKKEKPKKAPRLASKCLLLKTPDNRLFFTEEKHFPCLIEFGRTFAAEISVVKTKEQVPVLELGDLAKSICSPDQAPAVPEYEVVEVKLAAPLTDVETVRGAKLVEGRTVVDHVKAEMLAGVVMTANHLAAKFACPRPQLLRHFTRARRELEAAGHKVVRTAPGEYRVAPDSLVA